MCHFCLLVQHEDIAGLPSSLIAEQVESCKNYVASLKQRNAEVTPDFDDAVEHLRQLYKSYSNRCVESIACMLIEVLEFQNVEENAT